MKKKIIFLFFIVFCFSLSTSVFASPVEQTKTKTFEQVIHDFKVYWIKGYVTVDYYPSTGHITQTTARSALLGFTSGTIWNPDEPRITASAPYKRKVTFTGVLSTPVWSENIEGTMGVLTTELLLSPEAAKTFWD